LVPAEASVLLQLLDFRERDPGIPATIASGKVRFSATTGDGQTSSNLSYSSTTCDQTVASYDGAWAYSVAIAACSTYRPGRPPR